MPSLTLDHFGQTLFGFEQTHDVVTRLLIETSYKYVLIQRSCSSRSEINVGLHGRECLPRFMPSLGMGEF